MGGPFLGGFGFLFIVVPLVWLGIFLLVGGLARRRWRRGGFGPGAYGPGFGHGYGHFGAAARGAESTLAERFAQGDIDEKEYRARLEVLRANAFPAQPKQ